MKPLIKYIFLFLLFITFPIMALEEGNVILSVQVTTSQIKGIASDGPDYLGFSTSQVFRVDSTFSSNASSIPNTSPIRSLVTYDGTYFIVFNEGATLIESLSGSNPNTYTVLNSFTPPATTTVKAMASDRNGRLFLVTSDSNFYIIDEASAFSSGNADSAIIKQTNFPFSLNSVSGIAYDGMFLWYMDNTSKNLYKLDLNTFTIIRNYDLSSEIGFGSGDIAYDGVSIIVSGTSDGNGYKLLKIAINPKPITNITITDSGTGGALDISWPASTDLNITNYYIYYGVGLATNKHSTVGTTSSHLTGLQNFTPYHFYVIPVNSSNMYITNVSTLLPQDTYSRIGIATAPQMTHYVSKAGNNISPYDTETKASTNIQNAIDVSSPYDKILIIDNSVYEESLTLGKKGLIIQGAPNNKPTIQNYPTFGIAFIGIASNNIRLENLIFKNLGDSGSYAIEFIPSPQGGAISISNCLFEGTNTQYGIHLYSGSKTTIKNSRFLNFNQAVIGGDFNSLTIKNSTFDNNYNAINITGVCTNIEISYSKFYNTQNDVIYITDAQFTEPVSIYKNYFYQAAIAIFVNNLYYGNFSILNNTFYGANNYAFSLATASLTSDITFDSINNIFDNSAQSISDFNNSSGYSIIFNNYNNCFTDPNAYFSHTGNVNQSDSQNIQGDDPLLVDPNNLNFALQSSSPCIDKGRNVGLPYSGIAPDIGAYETKSITDNFSNFSESQIFSENNVEMDNRNLEQGQTAHILIKNLYYNINIKNNNKEFDKYSLRVDVFSITGKHIATLYNALASDNILEVDLNMTNLEAPSGLYFLRVRSNNFDITKKFTYVR